MRQLDEVVEKPDRAAGERHEQHGQGRHGVAAERQEADRGREQNQQPAHCRRSLFGDVMLRAFLTDVLAELLSPQEGDELRAGQDRDQQGDHPCQQDSAQALTAASASATRSRPTAREALTSTTSPGTTSSAALRAAVSASGAQRVTATPSPAPSRYARASSPTASRTSTSCRASSRPISS